MLSWVVNARLHRQNLYPPGNSNNLAPLSVLLGVRFLCFHQLAPSFQITPGLGVSFRDVIGCTQAQKPLPVSPLLATLTHSMSCKSFACHSYANTRDGGATVVANLCYATDQRFANPLFSYSYEPLLPQTLSFHIHTKPPGVWRISVLPCSGEFISPSSPSPCESDKSRSRIETLRTHLGE